MMPPLPQLVVELVVPQFQSLMAGFLRTSAATPSLWATASHRSGWHPQQWLFWKRAPPRPELQTQMDTGSHASAWGSGDLSFRCQEPAPILLQLFKAITQIIHFSFVVWLLPCFLGVG